MKMSFNESWEKSKVAAQAAADAFSYAEKANSQEACIAVITFAIMKALEDFDRRNPERG